MMFFPIARAYLSPPLLVALGFIIGIFGGFFGVGGSFLAGPALFALGVPFNFVVGTDLAHIVGKSIVAARKHRALGNIDLRLALIMVVGTIIGSEMGVQAIEELKRRANVNQVVGAVTIVVLTAMAGFVAWESWATLAMQKRRANASGGHRQGKDDAFAFDWVAKAVQRVKWAPVLSLPHSGIESVSLWAILGVAVVGGLFSGFLGGGAGYIRMPSMVYLLGIPTHVAIGTDLFEIIISAGYGTIRHALHGNVDVLIALVMQTGAAVGAQIGANLTQYFTGPRIRLAFAPLPLIGALLVIYGLATGRHH
ncbi:MAG: sulfite exporter TauE/SafE family protein [Verrucomicrobia bacterium]|nr:sulfite exporter TauE/SafE family protein [Verrucomicrobiota bacterium]